MIQDFNFGIEIEMTGITRREAAGVLAEYFHTQHTYAGGVYGKYCVEDNQSRGWKIVRDGSIQTFRTQGKEHIRDDEDYSVELVSPICSYEDIKTIQEIVRLLRKKGAFCNDSTGIHVHVDASRLDARALKNLASIMRSKEDILYKALQVDAHRERQYCQKVDDAFIKKLQSRTIKSLETVKRLWYNDNEDYHTHYHSSRYHALNLHSVFTTGTVEYRLFNGTLHAGKIKTYIQLSLAITNQAMTQKKASCERTVSENEKYTFRTWLLRLGMIGEEFKTARLHLLSHLDGNIAWKDPSQVERQKQRLAERRQNDLTSAETEEQTNFTETEENNHINDRGLSL